MAIKDSKIVKNSKHLIRHASSFSRAHMLIVVAVFAAIGGYVLYQSLASSVLGSALPARMPESSGTKTLYASPSGSGTSCSLSAPCSFNQVWISASSGTVINLLGGTYSGYQVVQSKRYSSTNPVTMQGYSGQTAIFTGCASSCSQNVLYFGNDSGIRIRSIVVTGTNSTGAGIKFEDDSYMEIDHANVSNTNGNGILVTGTTASGFVQTYNDHIQILNSSVTHAGYGQADNNQTHGIYMGGGSALDGTKHGVDNFVIANNIFYDQPTGWELQLGDQASNGFVVNNTFNHAYSTANSLTGAGIVVWGAGTYADSNDVIANNLLTSNSSHGIDPTCSNPLPGINIMNNLSYANHTSPDYLGAYGSVTCFTPGTNFVDQDPLYVNASSHDFHLQSGSPAIGKSNPTYTPPSDHDGNARSTTAPSLGAYEASGGTVTPAPTVNLTASPATITAGQSVTLSWTTSNATSCIASGAWSGSQQLNGSQTVTPTASSTYTLTCTGSGGSATSSTTVTVSATTSNFTTNLSQNMTISPPFTWTFNPGVASVTGYFYADGVRLATITGSPPYTFVLQPGALASGSHLLGGSWDMADGTHTTFPSNYSVTINNPADTTPPSISLTSPVNGSTVSGTVTAAATATDNTAVTKVEYYIDGLLKATDTVLPYTYVWDSTSVSNGSHNIMAKAYDAAGNSANSQVTVNVANADTTPPSTPTGLSASAAAYNKVNLQWAASTDNVGVAGYYIVRNGTTIAQTTGTGTTYTDTTATANTTYSYQVIAYDARNNTSALSNSASVTTPSAPDTTPPSQPTGLTASAVSSSQINLSWTASNDNVGVTTYDIYRNSAKIASVSAVSAPSFGDSGLAAGTTYSYYVIARDAAGNSSPASATAIATTLAPPPVTTGTLTGTVYSSKGGVIAGATVQLVFSGSTHTYTTNSAGQYSIANVPAGTYTVAYDARHYSIQSQTVNVASGGTTFQNVTLKFNPHS